MKSLGKICLLLLTAQHCAELPRPELPNAPTQNILAIIGSDFTTSTLSVMSLDNNIVYRDIFPAHADATIRYLAAPGALFVLNRLGRDNVTRLSQTGAYSADYEAAGGAASNIQSIAAFNTNTGLVSSYNSNLLRIINFSTGYWSGSIDISAYADADGYSEPGYIMQSGSAVFVALHKLNRNSTGAVWAPASVGSLLKISDTTFGVTSFATPFGNPSGKIRYYAANNSLVFASPGIFGSAFETDGGCTEFSLTSESFLASPLTEVQAGYEIVDCILLNATRGLMLGYDQNLNSILAVFNPGTHTIVQVMAFHSKNLGGYYSDMVVSGTRIYLADRNLKKPGIRIFSTADFSELTTEPIYTGLPPFSLDVVP